MTSSATNATMELHPLLPYLPYLIGIPFSVLVTCIVLVLVVIGKCVHMHHLNGIKGMFTYSRLKMFLNYLNV